VRIKNATTCTQNGNFYLLFLQKGTNTQKLELFIQCEVAIATAAQRAESESRDS
jgi:hypothetical protein